MRADGVVRTWQDDEGWGVIDSPDTPGGCWVHFGSVLVPGLRTLTAGQQVTFDYEIGEQDDFRFRAVEAWPAGRRPDPGTQQTMGPSGAYRSRLTLTFDRDEHPDGG